jgi:ribosomal protein S18 acetylase RimI-like enzyme
MGAGPNEGDFMTTGEEAAAQAAVPTAREAGVLARPATPADAAAIGETMARAFHDDPVICHLLPGGERRERLSPRLFRLMFRLGLPHGCCDVTEDVAAVALWRPPGKWETPILSSLTTAGDAFAIFGLSGLSRALRFMDVVEKVHPHEPHYYLQALGTDPSKQGKGWGGVVIRRQLAAADAAGSPCYLESSKPTNIPIYQSFGFEVTGEIKLPDGPTLWPMWRQAR